MVPTCSSPASTRTAPVCKPPTGAPPTGPAPRHRRRRHGTETGERQLAADVRLLLPGAGCIRCVGGLADMEQAEYEFHAPPGAFLAGPPHHWNARGRLGSLITLNSLAVSFGVQSWLDLLERHAASSIWHRLRWREGEAGWRQIRHWLHRVVASAKCRIIQELPKILIRKE